VNGFEKRVEKRWPFPATGVRWKKAVTEECVVGEGRVILNSEGTIILAK
jgi:hypothetical protein